MFGDGATRLQPAHVEDVGKAIAMAVGRDDLRGAIVECAGPHVYSYAELLRTVAHAAGLQPRLVPVPFAAWHALAWMAEALPNAPLTRNQVELMEIDTVAGPGSHGFADLGIVPRPVEATLSELTRTATAA
jgi:NADH dehydrogenase